MRSNPERLAQLLDMLMDITTDQTTDQATGYQALIEYLDKSGSWDSKARSGMRTVETDEGPRVARILDIRRTDRTGGIEITRIRRANGTEYIDVSLGRMDTVSPFIECTPASLTDWTSLVELVEWLDGNGFYSQPTNPNVDQDDDYDDQDDTDTVPEGVRVFSNLDEALSALASHMPASSGGPHGPHCRCR